MPEFYRVWSRYGRKWLYCPRNQLHWNLKMVKTKKKKLSFLCTNLMHSANFSSAIFPYTVESKKKNERTVAHPKLNFHASFVDDELMI